MDIGIIGLGAVGLFISSKLSERHDVTGYVRNQKQLNEIRENGIQINKDRYQIRVKTIERLQKHDLIIICVKQPHLAYLMPILNSLDKTCLLFIQNGLSHIQMIQELNHFIMLGVCEHGVSKVNSHQVQLNGLGQIKVGDFQEHNDAKHIQHQLYASDFPVFMMMTSFKL
ncbi:2-dehydropantoate 2-reductase N-terminal domain-containing protein [Piscibacillus salipiscarius]|uniref:2-dehydropantoate 2-reductase N-terminal domain-containing protein n=1 Tax=Piscibacillus salipiscarius TaxID=299480 RepID=UPI0006CF8BC7|nr:2-dehydropantoate 2-reductase N-terminal domain-containing protein [Piscibacillus salipiscarius]